MNGSRATSGPCFTNPKAMRTNREQKVQHRGTNGLAASQPIEFAITTVPRAGAYLRRLIASLGKGLHLRLVAGADDVSYLKSFRGRTHIEIITVPKREWKLFKDRRVHHRATWNYWRCLVFGPKEKKARGLTVFEDDVILAKGWLEHLHSAVAELEAQYDKRFVLALYSAHHFDTGFDFKKFTLPYPDSIFFGTQAMYFPNESRLGFARFLKVHGVKCDRRPYDLLLREYLRLSATPLAATYPSIAQHVGKVSTGLGRFHQSPQFKGMLTRAR